MMPSRLPLLAFTIGTLLLAGGAAAVYWPAGLLTAGLVLIGVSLPDRNGPAA